MSRRSSSRPRGKSHSTVVYSKDHSLYEKNRRYHEAVADAVAAYMADFPGEHIQLGVATDIHRNAHAVIIPFTLATAGNFNPHALGEDISVRANAEVSVILEPNPGQASNFNMSFAVKTGSLGHYNDETSETLGARLYRHRMPVVLTMLAMLVFILYSQTDSA